MSEQLPEAYDTLINIPEDEQLLDMIHENAVEVRHYTVAEDVIADHIPGIPKAVTDIWVKAVTIPYRQIHDTPKVPDDFTNIFADMSPSDFLDESEQLTISAYSLNIEAGAITLGGELNNLILRVTEPVSGLKITIRQNPNNTDFLIHSEGDTDLGKISMQQLHVLLASLSGEYPETDNQELVDQTLLQLELIGQKYGVSQNEFRLTAQLVSDDVQADSFEGAILLVETETQRDSRIELAVQRLRDYRILDAQVLNHFHAAYSQLSVNETGHDLDTKNKKIVTTGLGYSICDIQQNQTPEGTVRDVPMDDTELVSILDTLQQVIAAGGDFLLPDNSPRL